MQAHRLFQRAFLRNPQELSSIRFGRAFGQSKRLKEPASKQSNKEQEKAVLEYCLEYPVHGALRVSQQLILRDVHIGVGAIPGIWQRHNMLLKCQRLLRLEQHYKIITLH